MGKREARIEQALVKRIGEIGGIIRKSMWIGRRGCPDRFVMLPVRYREHIHIMTVNDRTEWPERNPWVECKAYGEPLDGHQEREINRMRSMGEIVLVIDSQELIDKYFPRSLR